MLQLDRERGDTIIEVILACSILALITVAGFSIMQRASASAYDALERSQVRLELNRQNELLNYLRDAYITAEVTGQQIPASSDVGYATNPAAIWQRISDRLTTNASDTGTAAPGLNTCTIPSSSDKDSFYITRNGSNEVIVGTAAIVAATGLPEPGKGLWVKRVKPSGYNAMNAKRRYMDFYILSCWQTTSAAIQYMSSIARIYVPE
ncbi:MAG: hypothetical protein WAT17_02265 [Candidatus Saccharimonadales bacterium]|jgi:type II secretory pathway pseudopilin PulG